MHFIALSYYYFNLYFYKIFSFQTFFFHDHNFYYYYVIIKSVYLILFKALSLIIDSVSIIPLSSVYLLHIIYFQLMPFSMIFIASKINSNFSNRWGS